MGFLRDLAESQVAVDGLLNFLIDRGYVAHELEGKKEQRNGDIRFYPNGDLDNPMDIEVKYDKRSKSSGNLCFELSNNKGLTGISITKAERVAYVCPNKDKTFDVFLFVTTELREFLFDTKNSSKVTIKNGGDGKRFSLALVKKRTIIEEKLFTERWVIDA
jgi:hypothetical protein